MQYENSPATDELFGGRFERAVPSLWLLLAFQNLGVFFNPFSYFLGRVLETLQCDTDGHSGENFLPFLSSCLALSSLSLLATWWHFPLFLEITAFH